MAKEDWSQYGILIASVNTFPTGAGLASSAAGLACLVASLAQLFCCKEEYPGQLTAIARQGSGSASRSLYGGFVRWQKGELPDGKDSIAVQIADEKVRSSRCPSLTNFQSAFCIYIHSTFSIIWINVFFSSQHWPEMRAVVLVVSDREKDTSSTSGMETSRLTSPLLQYRAAQVGQLMCCRFFLSDKTSWSRWYQKILSRLIVFMNIGGTKSLSRNGGGLS